MAYEAPEVDRIRDHVTAIWRQFRTRTLIDPLILDFSKEKKKKKKKLVR